MTDILLTIICII